MAEAEPINYHARRYASNQEAAEHYQRDLSLQVARGGQVSLVRLLLPGVGAIVVAYGPEASAKRLSGGTPCELPANVLAELERRRAAQDRSVYIDHGPLGDVVIGKGED